jgi:selenocysteine lyase/cysteine desulfurase
MQTAQAMTALTLADLRAEFDGVRDYVFLNHAASSPVPARVGRAMKEHIDKLVEAPRYQKAILESNDLARASVAALIGANPEEVAFVDNTATGVTLVAQGLPLEPGDEVILCDLEYPANVYPWMSLARKGIVPRLVPSGCGGLDVDAIRSVMSPRTKVVTASTVQFFTGHRTDVAAIGEFCRAHGLYFVLDGIQSVGALPIDVHALGVDALAVGGQKWMMATRGAGFLYVRDAVANRMTPILTGAGGVTQGDHYLQYAMDFVPGARRFQHGTLNSTGIAGLGAAAAMLSAVGLEAIERRILSLTALAIRELGARGYVTLNHADPARLAGIVTFAPEDADVLHEKLTAAKVVVSIRRDRAGVKHLRLSPHASNTEEDIRRCFDVLDGR